MWCFLRGLTFACLLAGPIASPASPDAAAPAPIQAVLWVGGFAHEFDAFAKVTEAFLPAMVPVRIEVVRDGSFLDRPRAELPDLIIMNHCFESVDGVLTEEQQWKLLKAVHNGVDVVAIHASYYSFVAWDAVRELFGARFTQHGSSDITIEVRCVDAAHPIMRGVPETFRVRSELYESTPLAEDCHLIAVAKEVGTDREFPSVWTRMYGRGRVVTILPAHWPDAYEVEEFQRLIASSCLWATGRLK